MDRTAANLVDVGFRYYDLGIRDAALGSFRASLALDPAYAPALDGAARIWRDWGQVAYALGSAHRATYFAPHSAEAWNTLGTVLQALRRDVEAAAAYRKALSLDSSAAYARNNLCQLAFLRGDPLEAVSECSSAIDISPDFLPAVNNLALIHAAGGNSAQALAAFSTVHREAIAQYNMGIVNLAQRDYSAAVTAFEAAYRAEPTLTQAYARAREARRLAARSEAQNAHPSR